jgi:hypothetical protein
VPDWQKAAGGKTSFDVSSVRQLRSGGPPAKNMFEVNAEDEFAPTGGSLFYPRERLQEKS